MARARSRAIQRHNELVADAAKNITELKEITRIQQELQKRCGNLTAPQSLDDYAEVSHLAGVLALADEKMIQHTQVVVDHLVTSVEDNARLLWQRYRPRR